MILLHRNENLKKLGWRQILQIHDELIFEGPIETVLEAKELIVKMMQNPLEKPLLVDLVVKCANNWFHAKYEQ